MHQTNTTRADPTTPNEDSLTKWKILMKWEIPRISDTPLSISLEAGDRLFVVGANGSGKSALLQHLASSEPDAKKTDAKIKRISAHRQTWIDPEKLDMNPRDRKGFKRAEAILDRESSSRWMEHEGYHRQSAVLFDLVDKENIRARSITRHVDEGNPERATELALESEPPFKQLNKLLALGTLTVSLENFKDAGILARHGTDDALFSIAEMSDGERNAVMIAANVLTVEPETILLIDEPERHLHRAIIEPFLSALFAQRPDCAFVISTHEIALPVANRKADVLMLRSCRWAKNEAEAWDVERLDAKANLPEKLKLAILGARERILFVEGTKNSLDVKLYNALFPDLSVIPQGNCHDVEKAVTGLRKSYDHHHVEAFGLIDRDVRPKDDIKKLAKGYVFALDVYSVEAMYYCSDAIEAVARAIEAVARRKAEFMGRNADEMIQSAKKKALDLLEQNDIAESMAARRCAGRVRNRILSQAPDWKSIRDNPQANADLKITCPINLFYTEELERFKELAREENLDGLFARYPLHKSGVFGVIAEALECRKKENYEEMVVSQIREDGALAQKLRKRVASLSTALKDPTYYVGDDAS